MAAAAIPWIIAAASAANAGTSIAGAADAGRAAPPRKHTVPVPPYIDALQQMTARYLAQNMTAQPPSFADYIKTGGAATFGSPAEMTPLEAARLGVVGHYGQSIPFMDPRTGMPVQGSVGLTPEQMLYLAQQYQDINRPGRSKKTMKQLFSSENVQRSADPTVSKQRSRRPR